MWSFSSRLLKNDAPGSSAKGNGAGRIQTYAEQVVGTHVAGVEIDRAGARKGSLLGRAWLGKCGASTVLRRTEFECWSE